MDGRDVEQRRVEEVALELRGVGGLLVHVELVEQRRLVVGDDLDRAQATGFRRDLHQQAREHVEQADVLAHHFLDARPDDLDHHVRAIVQACGMYLGDGGGGQRLGLEFGKGFLDRHLEFLLDQLPRDLVLERRHLILQALEFVGDVRRQQVAARREHLAELDEDRAEGLERETQTLAARASADGEQTQRRQLEQRAKQSRHAPRRHQVVEAVAGDDPQNAQQAIESHDGWHSRSAG